MDPPEGKAAILTGARRRAWYDARRPGVSGGPAEDGMTLPFSIFLALKYLRPRRTFISIVTLISIIGVMLGVAVLVVVLSVMSGFDDMWRDKILGFQAHITVIGYEALESGSSLIEEIEALPGVTGVSPFIQGLAFVQRGEAVHSPFFKAIDPVRERRTSRIADHMVAGRFDLRGDEVLIGRNLADRLRVGVGDELLVYSPQQFRAADEFHLPEDLTVAGIYEVGMIDFDLGYILCSMETARHLSGMEEGIQGLQVMTDDPYRLRETARRVEDLAGPAAMVRTWMQLNRQLFATLRVEKNMMFFLLVFIILVAAFSIMNTLITETVQKTHEIGLLKALGFRPVHVLRVFCWQGWVSGLIGVGAGIGVGLLALRYRNDLLRAMSARLGLELFPQEFYKLAEIPARVQASDLWSIVAWVMVLCTLAGLIPAWRAARLRPADALRAE
jgi:lipoprotein-releasing system permease protein